LELGRKKHGTSWLTLTSDDDTRKQFETNFHGALKMVRCVLPTMRLQRSGIIFFMGSIAGWHGVAAGGPYSASKFALEGTSFCSLFAQELAKGSHQQVPRNA
jgi:NAD(P)-dependent dehydrogenase (short-subunit alcohol dehydrogenase family)